MSELVIAQKQDLINIADAIREKTETTDGMGIDEMAALIAAIESGADLSKTQFTKMTCGTITPSQASSSLTINHNLGGNPKSSFVLFGRSG